MRRVRSRTVAAITAAALVLTTWVGLVVLSDAEPVRHVPMNDSGVWVTNDEAGQLGRQNRTAGSLDAVLARSGAPAGKPGRLDVLQDGDSVLLHDRDAATLTPVDVLLAVARDEDRVAIAPDARVDMRGGSIGVLDPVSGSLWAMRYGSDLPVTSLAALSKDAKPLASVGTARDAAALTISGSGLVQARSPSGKQVELRPVGTGFAEPAAAAARPMTALSETMVGDRAIAIDRATGVVEVSGKHTGELAARDRLAIQTPGPERRDVLVATRNHLVAVPLAGGEPRVLFSGANGTPAKPIVHGDCVFGAWSGRPARVVRACGDQNAEEVAVEGDVELRQPVFRTNRGNIVLNDARQGLVFDVIGRRMVGNWLDIKPPQSPDDKADDEAPIADSDGKPRAVADRAAGREGRTNQIFVVDNDRDPSGRVLAIRSVSRVRGGSVSIAPDGQSVGVSFASGSSAVTFTYTIDNGRDSDTTTARVERARRNTKPKLVERTTKPKWVATAGGALVLPVTTELRDAESDPLAVASARSSAGAVVISPDGTGIEFTPTPDAVGQQSVEVGVTDGRASITLDIPVTVVGSQDEDKVRATARPDVAGGFEGSEVALWPVANDLPGSDPEDPEAKLELSGVVTSESDKVKVTTDTDSGRVGVIAQEAGTYFLDYTLAYGAAPLTSGAIRVDVVERPKEARPPVAMPDSSVIHGDNPSVVDLLANDRDPGGSVLTVESAQPSDAAALSVAVISGRWLRIVPTQGRGSKATHHTIRYRVSNGRATATSDVVVTALPAVIPEVVTARADRATVRTGDTALINVLDNDSTAGGSPLTLLALLPGSEVAGQLPIADPSGREKQDLGTAFAVGSAVRYVAPSGVSVARNVVVEYVATTATGERATGLITVTIEPEPSEERPNSAPQPIPIPARAAAGETITIPVPGGIDPDGDSTIVAGIASAPTRGRVIGFSPTSLTYQAYPDADPGPDSFRYRVVDRYGTESSARIQVGVTPPQQLQAALAVPDTITVEPGRTAFVNPLENDLIARGDAVQLELVAGDNDADQARLDSPRGPVTAPAPAAGARPLVVPYVITGLSGPSAPSTITVRGEKGARNPPRVSDVVAKVTTSPTTTVDVLERAYDPDGDASDLRVSVADPTARVDGGKVTLKVVERMQAVPFTVTDADGAATVGVIYVPAAGSGGPYVPAGKVLSVDPGKSKTISLSDYITSPAGVEISAASSRRIWPSPAGALEVVVKGDQARSVQVSASADYRGPAAVVLEVRAGAQSTVLSIPVQVGPKVPKLSCPESPFTVSAGGEALLLDIANLCHVWTPEPEALAQLTYSARWRDRDLAGVAIRGNRSRQISLSALASSAVDQRGTLIVSVDGFEGVTADLDVVVANVQPPTLAPVRLDRVRSGERVSVDMRSYLTSALPKPEVVVTDLRKLSGPDVSATRAGSRIDLSVGSGASGVVTFLAEVSDAGAASNRRAQTTVTLEIFGVPEAPSGVVADDTIISGRVTLRWAAGAANGSPVDHFLVEGGGVEQRCPASPCLITGLSTGSRVSFVVRAHNQAGYSAPSARSPEVSVDSIPGAVTGLTATGVGDRQVRLSWGSAPSSGSPVRNYRVTWAGGAQDAGTQTSVVVTVSSNDQAYTFTVVAQNDAGRGPAVSASGQSFGRPESPRGFSAEGDGGGSVTLSWSPVSANGPGSVTYSVTENGASICTTSATSCSHTVALDGSRHTYSLTAKNGADQTSSAATASYDAIGRPDPIGTPAVTASGSDGAAVVSYSTGRTNGGAGTLRILSDGNTAATLGVPADGTRGTETINAGANGIQHYITLQLCNEQGQCVESGAFAVTPYGPLSPPTVTASLGTDGASVVFSASGFGNGRDATLSVTVDGTTVASNRQCKAATCSISDARAATPGTTVTVVAILVRKTDGQSLSSPAVTVDIPAAATPTVDLSGSPNDAGCGGAAQAGTCYALAITLGDFPQTATCVVTATSGDAVNAAIAVGTAWSLGNGTSGIGDYDGSSLTVTCADSYSDSWSR